MNDFTKLTEAELESRRQAVSERLSIGVVGFQRAIVEINRAREAEGFLIFGRSRKPKPESERPARDLSDWMTNRVEVKS